MLAEALVYYDQLLVYAGNREEFSSLISWFIERDLLADFQALIKEGAINFYEFAFLTNPFVHAEGNDLYNIVDSSMKEPNYFQRHIIEHEDFIKIFPDSKTHTQFAQILEGRVIEGRVEEFESIIPNAKADYTNPRRISLILQSFLDEIYAIKNLGRAPDVNIDVLQKNENEVKINWNLNLDQIAAKIGIKNIDTRVPASQVLASLPLSGTAHANRLLLAAMYNYADLYLPRPVSIMAGDKLYEASQEETIKTQTIIEGLQHKVEFPDLRYEINNNNIDFKEALSFRKKGQKFRHWLQDESERDRDAIIAYHNEIAKEANYIRGIRKTLQIFGVLGGAVAGVAVGTHVSQEPLMSKFVATVTGSGITLLTNLASKLGAEWKPVVFGKWYIDRIAKIKQTKERVETPINPLGLNRAQRRREQLRHRKLEKKLNRKR